MTTAAAPAPPRSGRARPTLRALRLPRPELSVLVLLAAVLDLWALDVTGWANVYYSAAVRSMSESWNAFLFGTFDASGVMTVDKPPMALWVQALSAPRVRREPPAPQRRPHGLADRRRRCFLTTAVAFSFAQGSSTRTTSRCWPRSPPRW